MDFCRTRASLGWFALRLRTIIPILILAIFAIIGLMLLLRYSRNSEIVRKANPPRFNVKVKSPAWINRIRNRYEPYREMGYVQPNALDLTLGEITEVTVFSDDPAVADEWTDRLSRFPELTRLYFGCSNTSSEGLRFLEVMPHLEVLSIYTRGRDDGATDATLDFLRNASNLQELSLYGSRLTGSGLANLEFWPSLRRLDLTGSRVQDGELKWLSRAPSLVALNLSGTKLDGTGFGSMKSLVNLRELDLRNSSVTDMGLELLDGMPALTLLNLDRTHVTGTGFNKIHSLPKVEEISLSESSVTDEGLKGISRFPALKRLNLYLTKVTDKGLSHLAGSHLESLSLNATAITDAGIPELETLVKLQRVDLHSTKVTARGIERLQRKFPALVISSDENLVNPKGLSP